MEFLIEKVLTNDGKKYVISKGDMTLYNNINCMMSIS